tara:strand:- start:1587 stop:1952 length:366 start_codon:yes stop_codon:yes gene_type:complete
MTDINDRPEPGKVYALTGFKNGGPSIAAGNTWAESEVVAEKPHVYVPQIYRLKDFRGNVQQVEVTFASDTKTYIGTIRGGRIVNTVSEKVRRVVAVGEADTPHGAAYQAILNYQARANNSN